MRRMVSALLLIFAFTIPSLQAQTFQTPMLGRGFTVAPGTISITTDGGPHEWDNLLAYLPFDDGAGAAATDATGNYPGTLVNTPSWVAGISSNAISFTGTSSQRISFASAITGNSSAFTWSVWIKTSNTGLMIIYSEGNSGSLNPRMFIDINDGATGNIGFGMLDDAGTDGFFTTAGISSSDGNWHMITVVQYDKSTRDIFMDGVWRASKRNVTLGTCTPNVSNIGVLQNNSFSGYATANIDGPRIWSSALSTATIVYLYGLQK